MNYKYWCRRLFSKQSSSIDLIFLQINSRKIKIKSHDSNFKRSQIKTRFLFWERINFFFVLDKHGWLDILSWSRSNNLNEDCQNSSIAFSISALCSYKLFPWSDRSTFRFVTPPDHISYSWHTVLIQTHFVQKVLCSTL